MTNNLAAGKTELHKEIDMNYPVILIYAVSVVIRALLAGFLKHADTYLDEWMYLGLANGMANGFGVSSVYGLPFPSYRWLYSLLLVPACTIKNIGLRFFAIAFTNSLVMNLAVFPVYLTAKKILKNRRHIILLVIVTAFMPYLNMTVSMMADVLFYTLASYIIYFNFRLFDWRNLSRSRRIYYAVLWTGFVILGFLTKYTAILFLVIMLLTIVMISVDGGLKKKKVVLLTLAFSILFMVIASFLITENGVWKIYNTLYVIFNGWRDIVIWKICGYHVFHIMLAFGIFPYILAVCSWKYFDKYERFYFTIITVLFFMTALVAVSTVYNFYWSGSPSNWVLLRYFMFLAAPFMIIFTTACEKIAKSGISKAWWIVSAIISLSVLFAAALSYPGPAEGSVTDHGLLFWALGYKYYRTFTGAALFFFVIVSLIILKERPKHYLHFFMLIWFILQFYNNFASYETYRKSYETPKTDDILAIREFINEHPKDTFLVIDNFSIEPRYYLDQPMRRADTYLDFPNVKRTSFELLNRIFNENNTDEIDLKRIPIPGYYGEYGLSEIDYVLVSNTCAAIPGEDYTDLEIGNSFWYIVYETKDPAKLKYMPSMSYSLPGTYTFSADEPFLRSNFPEGVSTEKADYALYGPFCNLSPGSYTFTVSYSYEGEEADGERQIVGYADMSGSINGLKDMRVPIYSDASEVSLDLYVEDACTNFEIRVFSEKQGLSPKLVTMKHTEK